MQTGCDALMRAPCLFDQIGKKGGPGIRRIMKGYCEVVNPTTKLFQQFVAAMQVFFERI